MRKAGRPRNRWPLRWVTRVHPTSAQFAAGNRILGRRQDAQSPKGDVGAADGAPAESASSGPFDTSTKARAPTAATITPTGKHRKSSCVMPGSRNRLRGCRGARIHPGIQVHQCALPRCPCARGDSAVNAVSYRQLASVKGGCTGQKTTVCRRWAIDAGFTAGCERGCRSRLQRPAGKYDGEKAAAPLCKVDRRCATVHNSAGATLSICVSSTDQADVIACSGAALTTRAVRQ